MTAFFSINGRMVQLLALLSIGGLCSFSGSMANEGAPLPTEMHQQLNDIRKNINEIKIKKTALETELKKVKDPEEIEDATQSIARLNEQLRDYRALFEKIALGGLDVSRFDLPTSTLADKSFEAYDWKKELVQIVQPIFTEMQRMTEGPRKREQLRIERKEIDSRIELISAGLTNIHALAKQQLDKDPLEQVSLLEKEWQRKKEELEHQQNIIALKLQDLTEKNSFFKRLGDSIWGFAKGRGLVLLVSFSVFFGLLYLFSFLIKHIEARNSEHRTIIATSIKWRVFLLIYQIISIVIAVFALLMILHSSGDMVLFGIAILIMLGVLLGARNSIPKYYRKLRLFLNMGPAREGERVIYQGLPWKIARINLYTVYLTNPLLDNGTLRLTVDELADMISRPVKMDEIWFPARTGDSLLMSNGTFVKVQRQTPESVYIKSGGGDIIYPAREFMADKPKNITYGYSVTVNFALSHEHFNLALNSVIETFKTGIDRYINSTHTDLVPAIRALTVDFRQVNEDASMLYTVLIDMGANSTGFYHSLPRIIQKACVTIAQSEGWTMPYSEILIEHKPTT